MCHNQHTSRSLREVCRKSGLVVLWAFFRKLTTPLNSWRLPSSTFGNTEPAIQLSSCFPYSLFFRNKERALAPSIDACPLLHFYFPLRHQTLKSESLPLFRHRFSGAFFLPAGLQIKEPALVFFSFWFIGQPFNKRRSPPGTLGSHKK